jgi:hypothetical protein
MTPPPFITQTCLQKSTTFRIGLNPYCGGERAAYLGEGGMRLSVGACDCMSTEDVLKMGMKHFQMDYVPMFGENRRLVYCEPVPLRK